MEGDILIGDWLRGLKGQGIDSKEGLAGAAINNLCLLRSPGHLQETSNSDTEGTKEEKHGSYALGFTAHRAKFLRHAPIARNTYLH